jgi:aspartate/methionine/tyrosine aminotransferase
MKYKRMPIEVESPEQLGYDTIACNLAESSVSDVVYGDLGLDLGKLILCYGDHLGKPELRELIAAGSTNLKKEDILLTAGAASALFIVASALLEESDHLVVMSPNYASNIETPKAIGCQISYLELRYEEGFRPDMNKLRSLIRPNTRLISITTPHNPTGVLLTEEELKEIISISEEHQIWLLVDETYRDLSFGRKLPVAAGLSERVISVSSLSKAYGLPGIRLGWLITRNAMLQELFLAAKEQIFLCNSVVDEEIAHLFLSRRDDFIPAIRSHVQENFKLLEQWMENSPELEWVKPEGGVVCFPGIRETACIDIEKFYLLLNRNYSTYVGPGHWFDTSKRYMRIGYGWPRKQELEQGLQNITSALMESHTASAS